VSSSASRVDLTSVKKRGGEKGDNRSERKRVGLPSIERNPKREQRQSQRGGKATLVPTGPECRPQNSWKTGQKNNGNVRSRFMRKCGHFLRGKHNVPRKILFPLFLWNRNSVGILIDYEETTKKGPLLTERKTPSMEGGRVSSITERRKTTKVVCAFLGERRKRKMFLSSAKRVLYRVGKGEGSSSRGGKG